MESIKPWIGPLLRSALEAYMVGKSDANQFSFDRDRDGKWLGITASLPEARTLAVVELPTPQGTLELLGSDGTCALPFTMDDKSRGLKTGQLLRANEIHFRVGDHFEPVRAEICPRSLEVTGLLNSGNKAFSSALRMTQDCSMQKLLQETLNMLESTSGSEDSDGEEVMSQPDTAISQRAFQTQVPRPCSKPASPKSTRVQRARSIAAIEQHQKETALNLLKQKKNGGNQPPLLCEARPRAHSAEDEAAKEPMWSSSVVSQHPLATPTDPTPEVSTSRPSIIEGSRPAKPQIEPDSPPPRLQRWSQQRVVNKYLPRRLSKISKSQLSLLDSEHSYYPPLSGRDVRPGTVPLGLLQKCIAQADQLGSAPEDADAQSCQSAESDKQLDEASRKEASPENEMPEKLALLHSSQCVGSDDWPDSSPEQPRMQLPPDSPSNASSSLAESPSEQSALAEATSPEPEISRAAPSHDVGSPQETSQPRVKKNRDGADSRALMSAGHAHSATVSPALQIWRTPHVSEAIHVNDAFHINQGSREQPGSSPHERIPSTYDRTASKLLRPAEKVPNAASPSAGSWIKAPVMNSMNGVPNRKHPAHHTMEELREAKRFKITSRGWGSDSYDPAYEEDVTKRRAIRHELLARLGEKQPGLEHSSTSSAMLGKSHAREVSEVTNPSTGALRRPHQCNYSSPRDHSGHTIHSIHTNHPHHSNLAGGLMTRMAVHSHLSTKPASPLSPGVAPKTLFNYYRSVYQDYQGDEHSFENAIGLLRRLRDDNKGPHPFLFDDFIFHHHHSYRDYLVKVASSSDDPLSYGLYYDRYIESPVHVQNVVTLGTLASNSPPPEIPARERACAEEQPICFTRNAEKLVRVHQPENKNREIYGGRPAKECRSPAVSTHAVGVQQIREASPELGSANINPSRDDVRAGGVKPLHTALETIAKSRAMVSRPSSFSASQVSISSTSVQLPQQRHALGAESKAPVSTPTNEPGDKDKKKPAMPLFNLTHPRRTSRESKPRVIDFFQWRPL